MTSPDFIYGSMSGSNVVGQVYRYCNQKITVCGLPDADRVDSDILTNFSQQASTSVLTRFRELSGQTHYTDDSDALQNGTDNMSLAYDVTVTPMTSSVGKQTDQTIQQCSTAALKTTSDVCVHNNTCRNCNSRS